MYLRRETTRVKEIVWKFIKCYFSSVKRYLKIKGTMNGQLHRLDSETMISDKWINRLAKWTEKLQERLEKMDGLKKWLV